MAKEITKDIFEEYKKDEENEYSLNTLLDLQKIRETGFDVTNQQNFISLKKGISNLIKRTNIVYYGLLEGEIAVPQEQTEGDMLILMVNKKAIQAKIASLKRESGRHKIKFLHISVMQILLKSTFSAGIDAPIRFLIRDDRIQNEHESVIATGNGNLVGETLKFNINLQLSMSLMDQDLDKAVIIKYKLDRTPLMKKGNHPFTAFYRMNYALTNSHHSLTFRNSPKIEVDKLFGNILKMEVNTPMFRLKNDQNTIKKDDRASQSFRLIKDEPSSSSIIPKPFYSPLRTEEKEEEPKIAQKDVPIILPHEPISLADVSTRKIKELQDQIDQFYLEGLKK
ncbi:uncharacterized protein LOC132631210 [Lycium barbarum]|uniref:uncharacterized protein LOC132631210 n=1 Tax=Lycium barbarum TaxID=112863 RepID=UPI00293E3EBB|nr:uncharacterized protein LOC132631210 [Lycium barbarum]